MSLFGEPFTAKCLKSGITVEVAEGQSLLQALLDAGISMDYSCEGGVCGTCMVPLVSGEVEHLDEFLMDDEKETNMITCVSRGEGEIEIDV
ncbi:2Fe-2S iron-sulfur cluster binding domain-containing protein [Brachybacterium muris]|uniref:2Fe-2S iron-sulfur cluster-binding protein n=1 Tax=Brachybacterium muris TaxID=219301 RepID=UPI0021A8A5EB|nr:2Fe-2S iron-sulfur cluster binding domain-containing protein [Brachybacterium muris]MCT1431972.1 2Fe-2S iron-sulfur cluster binding domain-containing protein [Brachybacterium muris]